MDYFVSCAIGYFLGCINAAYFLSRSRGFDIRDRGSGNAGASNVVANMGWKYGVMTAAFDILKGFFAVLIAQWLFPNTPSIGLIAGMFAVIGHIFPFYLRFRGGKGFASYIGAMFAFNWKVAAVILIISLAIGLITSYIALATLTFSTAFTIYYILQQLAAILLVLLIFVEIVIIVKHLSNIKRILSGTEDKISSALHKKQA